MLSKIVCLLSMVMSLHVLAAGPVRGVVADNNGKPLAGVSIRIEQNKKQTIVPAIVSDDKGMFEFTHINPGKYSLSFSHVGFAPYITDSITVKDAVIDLGTIRLKSQSAQLGDVSVTANKKMFEQKSDRLVMNVESTISSAGNTAFELIERLPGVSLDADGNIIYKGRQGVLVMIDNRPTQLSVTDVVQMLRSLSSSSIDRVELITHPSAKYEASGTSAIINIVFKRDQRAGTFGNLTLTKGQSRYPRQQAGVNLAHKTKKISLFGNYSGNLRKGYVNLDIVRRFRDADTVSSIYKQATHQDATIKTGSFRTGMDYNVSKKTTIGAVTSIDLVHYDPLGNNVTSILDAKGNLIGTSFTNSTSLTKSANLTGNLNLRHTYDSTGRQISFDVDAAHFSNNAFQDFKIQESAGTASPFADTFTNRVLTNITIFACQGDYLLPLNKQEKMEMGFKASNVKTDNDIQYIVSQNGIQTLDPNRSNHFIYRENIAAAYVNYTRSSKRYDLQFGLRAEATGARGDQITTNTVFTKNFIQLFPSALISKNLDDNNALSLSYFRRIQRANYKQLNPFRNIIDRFTEVVGNANLVPQIENDYELKYTFKQSYSIGISYSASKNIITDVFSQNDITKVNTQYPENIATSATTSLSVVLPFRIAKNIQLNISSDLMNVVYRGLFLGQELVNKSVTFNGNISSSVVFKKGYSAELSGNYSNSLAYGLFTILPRGQLNAGIQKVSNNKKHVFKLSASDFLYTNNVGVQFRYQNMDVRTDRKNDTRFIALSYTYKFGKLNNSLPRTRKTSLSEEAKRAN